MGLKNSNNTNAGKDVEKLVLLSIAMGMSNGSATLEHSLTVSYKTMCLSYDPALVLWNVHPRELKISVHTKTCRGAFIVALFRIGPNWKQPECPSVGEYFNTFWSIHTTEYYSAIKRHEYREQLGRIARALCFVSKANLKRYILCDSVYIVLSKWQNCGVGEQITGCRGRVAGLGEDWWNYKRIPRGSSFVEMEQLCIFIVTVVMQIYVVHQIAQLHTHAPPHPCVENLMRTKDL